MENGVGTNFFTFFVALYVFFGGDYEIQGVHFRWVEYENKSVAMQQVHVQWIIASGIVKSKLFFDPSIRLDTCNVNIFYCRL